VLALSAQRARNGTMGVVWLLDHYRSIVMLSPHFGVRKIGCELVYAYLIATLLLITSLLLVRAIYLRSDRGRWATSLAVIEAMEEGVVIFDADGTVVAKNSAAERIAAPYEVSSLFSVGGSKEFSVIFDDGTLVGDRMPVAKVLATGESVAGLVMGVPQPDGFHKWISVNVKPLFGGSDRRWSALMTVADVTAVKQQQELVRRLAYEDEVTGLPNRRLFADWLDQAIERSRRNGVKFAILFLDLNDFKLVNDSFGHHTGDELLSLVAKRLKASVRASDTVARYGGDEFIILLPEIKDAGGAAVVAEKVKRALQAPFVGEGGWAVTVSASIGVAVYPDHGLTARELLESADRAMYASKSLSANHNPLIEGPGH